MAQVWEVSSMKAKYKLMVDLHIAGLKNIQIAEEMDCTPESVGMILRSPIVQEEIARRRNMVDRKVDEATANVVARAKQILEQNTERAATVLCEQIGSEDKRLSQNACLEVLEMAFGQKSNTQGPTVVVNADQVLILQQTLSEIQAS